MSAAADTAVNADKTPLPTIRVPMAQSKVDFVTIAGLLLSFALIVIAIMLGQSNANFFNVPSLMIVVFGTITATSISYTGKELLQSLPVIAGATFRPVRNLKALATSMMGLATVARKRGVLQLSNYEKETQKEPFLSSAMRLVVDGYSAEDIRRILQQDIDMEEERSKRAASILRRASEVAPAMGLIGTLVGLVQMLADLENPDTIGKDEVTAQTMTLKTAMSMLRQENPRNLELLLNALLPPSERIRYFD